LWFRSGRLFFARSSVDWSPLAGEIADQFDLNLRPQIGGRYRYTDHPADEVPPPIGDSYRDEGVMKHLV